MTPSPRREVALGVVVTGLGLGAATLFAQGVATLFQQPHTFLRGVGLIFCATALRLLGGLVAWSGLHRERANRTRHIVRRLWLHVHAPGSHDVVQLDGAAQAARAGVGVTYLATSALVALLALIPVWCTGGWLSASLFLALIVGSVPFYIRAGRSAEASSAAVAARTSDLAELQLRTLDAMSDMRSLGTVDYASTRLEVASTATATTLLEGIRSAMGSSLITDFIGGVAIGLVAMVVGFDLLHGRRSLDHAMVALFLVIEINTRVRTWASSFHQREDAERALTVLSAEPPEWRPLPVTGSIVEARSLSLPPFSNTLDFTVRAGDRLLVTGPSGAGKTTLLRSVVGLSALSGGSVRLTSEPIGWVRADSQFFAGTLRDNLCVRRPVETSDVLDTLTRLGLSGPRFATLDGDITTAAQFSDGERARLAIARSLLAGVVLMVIDDVAGLFDDATLELVAAELQRHHGLAVVEAAHERRLLRTPTTTIELVPR